MISEFKEKAPAFQFYPKDFLSDSNVQILSYEQVGWYIILLCHCWLEGSIPLAPLDAMRLLRITEKEEETTTYDKMAELLETCFSIHPEDDSKLINRRIERERDKQIARAKERSESGIKGADARWNDKMAKPSIKNGIAINQPMAKNGSSSSISSSSSSSSSSPSSITSSTTSTSSVKKTLPLSGDSELLADLLKSLILLNNPTAKTPANLKDWVLEADRLFRLDERTNEEATAILRWSQADSFWKANILSMSSFRKHYDKLKMKMKSGGTQNDDRNNDPGNGAAPIPGKYSHL